MGQTRKGVLVVIDGFGANPNAKGNAILSAKTPFLDYLWSNFPHTLLKAAEEEVGLSFGQIGNSEVGHMAIGSGRVIPSPNERINIAIKDESFFKNESFLKAIENTKGKDSKLHLMGMISEAGVHADLKHIVALLKLAKQKGVKRVFIHAILDGRDTGPKEAQIYLERLNEGIKKYGGKIATIAGRAYAMDRNKNWDKIKAYYDAITGSTNQTAQSPKEAINKAYKEGLDDESCPPTLIDPEGKIENGDSIIFTNFRADRARQITKTITDTSFKEFKREVNLSSVFFVTMTQYEKGLDVQIAFPPVEVKNTLTETLEKAGLSQVHIAETEKYAHVTYFLNGGREKTLPHERYVKIDSYPPDELPQHPEMKAREVTKKVLEEIEKTDFVIVNFANPDMVGHTGDLDKTVKAVQVVDECIGKIAKAILPKAGYLFITADHGNAEQKIDLKTGKVSKDHTVNPVPFIMAHADMKKNGETKKVTKGAKTSGILQDVSPTVLSNLGVSVPPEMSGAKLF